ncbi:heparinase II/III family protein [Actinopolymorpha sp. B11F2]|uniref:heparinase II/III family protein n=1 Tax=Actinopolymorpha sp. B11F2 TaxID=3160862 RepID=UPI0032E51680
MNLPRRRPKGLTDMLTEIFTSDALATHLPEPGGWRPVPDVDDRAFWSGIDDTTRRAHLAAAEDLCQGPWPELPATLWLDFRRTGNRVRYQDPAFARRSRLAAAVIAACLTDEDRWHEEVLDGVWLLCEETSWCIPAHDLSHSRDNAERADRGKDLPDPGNPTLDLFAAETGSLLAWTYAVLADRLRERSHSAVQRLVDEVRTRILVPQRTVDSWVWFGRVRPHVNNWNPWINSNVLACSLLLDDDPADIQLTVERAVEGLEVFVGGYLPDGACTEGHSYWWRAGASLAECLETLYSATGGALDGFGVPLVQRIGRYPHGVHIADRWYVNVSDGPASIDGRAACGHVLYRYGVRIGDDEVVAHGRSLRGPDGPVVEPGTPLGRCLLALADAEWRAEPARPAPLVAETWWPNTQLLVARTYARRDDGLLLSVKGGHNAEDHNHNDVGTVLVAVDGHPVLVDAGVGEYTATTFSARRYEIWSLRSTHHNVPLINGHDQPPGAEFAARDVELTRDGVDRVGLRLDLAGAYPAEAGCRAWVREVTLDRSVGDGRVVLSDAWELDGSPSDVRLHFIASGEPDATAGSGVVRVPGVKRGLTIGYDPALIDVSAERIALDDRRLEQVWGGPYLWRLALVVRTPERSGAVRLVLDPA